MNTTKNNRFAKGQGMVEFAIALPILMMLVLGLIEVGNAVFVYSSVTTASRQAARYGSTTGLNQAGIPRYQDCAGIRNAAKEVGFLSPIQDSDIIIQYDHGPGTSVYDTCVGSTDLGINVQSGDRISVTVNVTYTPIVPLVPIDPFPIHTLSNRTLLANVYLP